MTETKTSIHNETVSGLTAPQRVLFEYPFEYAICGNGAVLTRFSLGDENEHELPGERSATVPPTLGNHPLVAIREGALSRCRYLSDVVDIPDTVLFIGMGAFAATDIASIRIPASVAFIGEKAFALTLTCNP